MSWGRDSLISVKLERCATQAVPGLAAVPVGATEDAYQIISDTRHQEFFWRPGRCCQQTATTQAHKAMPQKTLADPPPPPLVAG